MTKEISIKVNADFKQVIGQELHDELASPITAKRAVQTVASEAREAPGFELQHESPGPTMFDPERTTRFGVAQLNGVEGIGALGHQALVELRTPGRVEALHLVPPAGQGELAGRQGVTQGGLMEEVTPVFLGALADVEDWPIQAQGFFAEKAVSVGGGQIGHNGIEDDEGAAPDVVPAFEGFRVQPFDAGAAEPRPGG